MLAAAALTMSEGAAGEKAEETIILAASTPGPGRAKAMRELGNRQPSDLTAVAKAIVDGAISKDVEVSISATQALTSLAYEVDEPSLARALAAHADRLIQAAETDGSVYTNPALEVLARAALPSGPTTARLIALLASAKRYRKYTVVALANSRPLTPEILHAILPEAAGAPLTQQDLAIAMTRWPAESLAGEDIERAVIKLFNSVMGNIPPYLTKILQRRGGASPLVGSRLESYIDDPAESDHRIEAALAVHAACGNQDASAALVRRLLSVDVRRDPVRTALVLRHCANTPDLIPAVRPLLSKLIEDDNLDWWVRHRIHALITRRTREEPVSALDLPTWVITVDSASGWPIDDARTALATAPDAEARTAFEVTIAVIEGQAADAGGPDRQRRSGSIQVAAINRWLARNPDAAVHPTVIRQLLHGYYTNYEATSEDRAQCTAFIDRLLAGGFTAGFHRARYPQGGPAATIDQVVNMLAWSLIRQRLDSRDLGPMTQDILSRLETIRHLRQRKAPDVLLLQADRRAAAAIRNRVLEKRIDPVVYREDLAQAGFSVVPVADFIKSLETPDFQARR